MAGSTVKHIEPPTGCSDEDNTPITVVDVAFVLPVRQVFTYEVPPVWAEAVRLGSRVRAPLRGRETCGVVVSKPRTGPWTGRPLRKLLGIIDPEHPVRSDLLELAHWVSDYYMCSLGEALGPVVSGAAPKSEMVIIANPVDWESDVPDRRRITVAGQRLLRHLRAGTPVTVSQLMRRGLSRRAIDTTARRLADRGVLRIEWRVRHPPIPSTAVITGLNTAADPAAISAEIREFFTTRFDAFQGRSWTAWAGKFPGGRAGLRSLMVAGTVKWEPVPSPSEGHADGDPHPEPDLPAFSKDQRVVYDRLAEMIDRKRFAAGLLWGPTGSGKTAVYCAAIRRVWEQGRSVLFLVPEISLAQPMIRRLITTLRRPVGVWHSGLTPSQRHWMARGVAQGHYSLVVGARSAVFAPLPDLGLIIVDEEHSESYKQSDPAPRYHARDIAVVRARIARCVCLLGSATPSCESFHNAKSGKFELLRLSRRVPGRMMPLVRLVDLSRRKLGESSGWVTDEMRTAILETIRSGQKAIVFLNRRGYATMVACRSCGHYSECPDCGLTLTYHAKDQSFRCHICTYRIAAFTTCPKCGGTDFLFRGVGTQKIEETLQELDPAIRLARLDGDVASRRGAAERILSAFARGEFNLLVGTQMVAKGLDVAGVGLVGVIWADQQMAFPDFRSEERTFQLLTQVAGRAGRSGEQGQLAQVLVQTFHADHDLIELAAAQDADLFFARELPQRKALHYPPFTRLILVAFSAVDESRARKAAQEFATSWQTISPRVLKSARILGPAPGAIPRRAGEFMFHCLIKTPVSKTIRALIGDYRDACQATLQRAGVTMTVDADPTDFW